MVNTLSIMRLDSLTELNEQIRTSTMIAQVSDVRNLLQAYKELSLKLKQKEIEESHRADFDRVYDEQNIERCW